VVPRDDPKVRSSRLRDDQPQLAAKVRATGGVPDAQVIGDTAGAVAWLRAQPYLNGKVGVLGTCSGGRHTFLFACHTKSIDAAVDLWGGRVVMSKEELTPKQPTAPIEFTKNLSALCSVSSAMRIVLRPRSR
jgi:carboxymethylenebutenolidase